MLLYVLWDTDIKSPCVFFLPKKTGGMEIMSKGRMDNILHTAKIDKRAKMYS